MERARASRAVSANVKPGVWDVFSAVISNPFAPAHLPFVFSGSGILLVLFLGISGALSSNKTQTPVRTAKSPQQFTAAQRAAAPVITNSAPMLRSDNKTFKPQINFLEAKIALLESEIARLKDNLDAARTRDQSLSSRLTSIETSFNTMTASINPKVTHLPAAALPGVKSTIRPLPPLSALPPLSVLPPKTANTAKISTQGLNSGIPEFSRTLFAVYLGSNTNRIRMQNYREELRAKYSSLFKNQDIYLAQPEKGEKKFRLIVGPLTNLAVATKICVELKTDGKFCHQDIFPKTLLTEINSQ